MISAAHSDIESTTSRGAQRRRSALAGGPSLPRRGRGVLLSLLAPLLLLVACESETTAPGPGGGAGELAVILNSTERSLTVFPVDDPESVRTIGVAPEGSPASLAVRGRIAVVPLGTYPFVAVVDLDAGAVVQTVALPDGSGATGAAFLNDSIALVANSDINSVSPINVLRGTAGEPIEVGRYPQAIEVVDGVAYVINGELENWMPAGPGSITLIDESLEVVGTIALSGENPGSAAAGDDGRLYVLHSGSWGANDGSLSVVDLAEGKEISHHTGFGDFPGAVVTAPGRVLVVVGGVGILEWDPATEGFVHGLDDPLTPGETPPVSTVGFDSSGRFYVLNPGNCIDPGRVYLIGAGGEVEAEVRTGACPYAIDFGS